MREIIDQVNKLNVNNVCIKLNTALKKKISQEEGEAEHKRNKERFEDLEKQNLKLLNNHSRLRFKKIHEKCLDLKIFISNF